MKQKLLLLLSLAGLGVSAQTIVSTAPQNKKVILEEFTGINCVYCPQGHAIANSIKQANPNNVFLINVHVGGYATPGAGQPDFRTSFGTAIANQSNLTGYPAGTVNRTAFTGLAQNGGAGTAMSRNNWTNASNQILSQASYVNVGVTGSIDVNTRVLTVNVEAYYTGNSPVTSNRLNVALLQNNTLGPQTGGNMGDSYNHQHRLIHLLTGQWGETYTTVTTGTLVTRTYTYTIPAAYNSVIAEMGEFELVAFVTESQQKIISGNGATPTYTGLTANDVKIKDIAQITEQCTSTLTPSVEIQNKGQATLTSLPITYSINGGTPQVYNWSGSLAPLARTTVTLPGMSYTLQPSNTLNVSIPADDNLTDNTGLVTFDKAPETTYSNITIKITLDAYGSETSWTLKNSAGTTVAQSPVYSDSGAAGSYPQADINLTLPNDCYTFLINDAYGDGMDSGYGVGSYEVWANGVLIPGVQGGAFGSSDSRRFGVANPLANADFETTKIAVFPNPSEGIFTFISQSNFDLEVTDITGKVVFTKGNVENNQSIDLSSLQAGVYLAKMISESTEQTLKLIVK